MLLYSGNRTGSIHNRHENIQKTELVHQNIHITTINPGLENLGSLSLKIFQNWVDFHYTITNIAFRDEE